MSIYDVHAKSGETSGVSSERCSKALARLRDRHPQVRSLDDKQKKFLREWFLPVVGLRGLYSAKHRLRNFKVAIDSITWPGYKRGHVARVVWVDGLAAARFVELPGERRLEMPREKVLDSLSEEDAGLIKRWLMGHPLHPFIYDSVARDERKSLGEPALLHRWVQKEGLRVGEAYQKRYEETGDPNFQRYLYVAPTGSGKSEVYAGLLATRLQQRPEGLHLALVDRDGLATQLEDDTLALRGQKGVPDFQIVRWGGDETAKQDYPDFESLLARLAAGGKPVVLVTTMQSLKSKTGFRDASHPEKLVDLRTHLRGLTYDEAHHLNAPEASVAIKTLINGNRNATALAITATPDDDLIDLFGGHAFWAYLDTADEFLEAPRPARRSISDVVAQLRRAFDLGELTGFDDVEIMTLRGEGEPPVHKRLDGRPHSRLELNPFYYERVLAAITKSASQNLEAVICNTRDEAERLSRAFNEVQVAQGSRLQSRVFTSEDAPAGSKIEAEILADARAGKIHVLFSVKKLDEGINILNLKGYRDLTPNPTPREFVQRVGRTTRIFGTSTRSRISLISNLTAGELQKKFDAMKNTEFEWSGGGGNAKKTPEAFVVDTQKFLDAMASRNSENLQFWEEFTAQSPWKNKLKAFRDPKSGALGALARYARSKKIAFSIHYGPKKALLSAAAEITDEAARAEAIAKIEAIDWKPEDGATAKRGIHTPAYRILDGLKILAEAKGIDPNSVENEQRTSALFGNKVSAASRFDKIQIQKFRKSGKVLDAIVEFADRGNFALSREDGFKQLLSASIEKETDGGKRATARAKLESIGLKPSDWKEAREGRGPAIGRVMEALAVLVECRYDNRVSQKVFSPRIIKSLLTRP